MDGWHAAQLKVGELLDNTITKTFDDQTIILINQIASSLDGISDISKFLGPIGRKIQRAIPMKSITQYAGVVEFLTKCIMLKRGI